MTKRERIENTFEQSKVVAKEILRLVNRQGYFDLIDKESWVIQQNSSRFEKRIPIRFKIDDDGEVVFDRGEAMSKILQSVT